MILRKTYIVISFVSVKYIATLKKYRKIHKGHAGCYVSSTDMHIVTLNLYNVQHATSDIFSPRQHLP